MRTFFRRYAVMWGLIVLLMLSTFAFGCGAVIGLTIRIADVALRPSDWAYMLQGIKPENFGGMILLGFLAFGILAPAWIAALIILVRMKRKLYESTIFRRYRASYLLVFVIVLTPVAISLSYVIGYVSSAEFVRTSPPANL